MATCRPVPAPGVAAAPVGASQPACAARPRADLGPPRRGSPHWAPGPLAAPMSTHRGVRVSYCRRTRRFARAQQPPASDRPSLAPETRTFSSPAWRSTPPAAPSRRSHSGPSPQLPVRCSAVTPPIAPALAEAGFLWPRIATRSFAAPGSGSGARCSGWKAPSCTRSRHSLRGRGTTHWTPTWRQSWPRPLVLTHSA